MNNLAENIPINLRSDEMHEVLGHRPHWAIRWGMTLVGIMLAAVLALAFYIPYPDIVSTRVALHTQTLPTKIVAPLNGKIAQLWVKQGDCVAANDLLAVLNNTTNFAAWQQL